MVLTGTVVYAHYAKVYVPATKTYHRFDSKLQDFADATLTDGQVITVEVIDNQIVDWQ